MSRRPLDHAVVSLVTGDDADQVQAVFGTRSSGDVAQALGEHVRAELGTVIVDVRYTHVSVGVALELALADGQTVVLKALSRRTHARTCAAVEVQRRVAAAGFPAPRPIGPVQARLAASVYLMTACDRGETITYDEGIGELMATEYARLVRLTRDAGDVDVPDGRLPRDRLWPTPHAVLFDIDGTVGTAGPIDAIATAARATLSHHDDEPLVVVHGDWALQNVALRARRLVGVFDWDSITAIPETLAVAGAAAFHQQDWRRGPDGCDHDFYPGPAETLRFAERYEQARGEPFTPAQWQALRAALVTRLAYQARCEHALDPATEGPATKRLFVFAEAFGFR